VSASELNRLFISIAAPDAVKAELIQAQRELREILPRGSVSWTQPEKLHLTLRFLGAVDAARRDELQHALHAATFPFGPLGLVCERLGCFPDLRFPRVLWAWVCDDHDQLPALVESLNMAVESLVATPAEARFTGHITLARPRQLKHADARRLAEFVEQAAARRFGGWRADELELVRSELSRAGSNYTVLAKFPLGRNTGAS
jgi:2'-5' RNA ligase